MRTKSAYFFIKQQKRKKLRTKNRYYGNSPLRNSSYYRTVAFCGEDKSANSNLAFTQSFVHPKQKLLFHLTFMLYYILLLFRLQYF